MDAMKAPHVYSEAKASPKPEVVQTQQSHTQIKMQLHTQIKMQLHTH